MKRGETIDFIVDLRGDLNSDSFTWTPRLRYVEADGTKAELWNAKTDFAGPAQSKKPLTPLERYAQALLLANEFVFVD